MKKKPLLTLRMVTELLLAAYFFYSSVHEFRAPRYALPTYIYLGGATLSLLIALFLILDAIRIARRLRLMLPEIES